MTENAWLFLALLCLTLGAWGLSWLSRRQHTETAMRAQQLAEAKQARLRYRAAAEEAAALADMYDCRVERLTRDTQ